MGRSEQGKQRYGPLDVATVFFCEHCAGTMGTMTGAVWHQLGGAHLHCIVAAEEPLPDFVRASLSRIPVQIPSKLGIWFRSLWLMRQIRRWSRWLARHRRLPAGAPEATGGAIDALVCLSSAIGKMEGWSGKDSDLAATGIRQDLITAGAALSWALSHEIDVSRVLLVLGSVERMGADLQPIQETAQKIGVQLSEVRRSHRLTCLDHAPLACPVDQLIREVASLLSRV